MGQHVFIDGHAEFGLDELVVFPVKWQIHENKTLGLDGNIRQYFGDLSFGF